MGKLFIDLSLNKICTALLFEISLFNRKIKNNESNVL